MDGPRAVEYLPDNTISNYNDSNVSNESAATVLAPRADGLVRQLKTKKVISREEIQERTETEDVKHLGDFSDAVSYLIFYCLVKFPAQVRQMTMSYFVQVPCTQLPFFREFYVDDHRCLI